MPFFLHFINANCEPTEIYLKTNIKKTAKIEKKEEKTGINCNVHIVITYSKNILLNKVLKLF
jgi:hypothetical protein